MVREQEKSSQKYLVGDTTTWNILKMSVKVINVCESDTQRSWDFFFFSLHHAFCGKLGSLTPSLEAQSPNHWAAREFPKMGFLFCVPDTLSWDTVALSNYLLNNILFDFLGQRRQLSDFLN